MGRCAHKTDTELRSVSGETSPSGNCLLQVSGLIQQRARAGAGTVRPVSVYRSAAVLGQSNFGTLQRVPHFGGRLVLERFCARGRAHSTKRLPRPRIFFFCRQVVVDFPSPILNRPSSVSWRFEFELAPGLAILFAMAKHSDFFVYV